MTILPDTRVVEGQTVETQQHSCFTDKQRSTSSSQASKASFNMETCLRIPASLVSVVCMGRCTRESVGRSTTEDNGGRAAEESMHGAAT